MDSLLSIPSYTGAFTGLHTVVSFLEKIELGAIIQTRNLQSEPIQAIINENLSEFISQEQSSRTQFGYPPATVLVKIILEVLKTDAREATEYLETCLAKSNPDILAKKSSAPTKIIIQAIIKIPSPQWNDDESPIRRTIAELSTECAIEVNPESVL
jgi:primosomal protein N'